MDGLLNRKFSSGVSIALAFIGILSCSDQSITGTQSLTSDELSVDAARIATLTVNFNSSSLSVGDTTRAIATLRDSRDRPLSRAVTWSSSNSSVATVGADGLVTGTGNGSAVISASSGSITGSGSIDVGTAVALAASTNPGTVTDLSVVSTDSSSATLTFTQVDDGTGQPAKYDVRYAIAPISWGSAASTSSGSCTTPLSGTAIGSALTCTVAGLKAATKYNFQLVAFRGTLNQSGIVFGALSNVAAGTTTVSSPVPVATVTVSPATASVQVGATVQLSATTRDANGNVLTGRTIGWTSSNTSVATVSASGLVSGVAAGSSQITATSEGKTGSAAITVTASQPPPGNPGTVTNLGVSALDSTSVVLSFTQVDDGTGQPAKYDIRFAVAPIAWGTASSVTVGTCKTPVVGTAIGATLTCSAQGLRPATTYNFQLVAFRGTLGQMGVVFGSLSNIVAATTTSSGSPPPPPPPPPPTGGPEPGAGDAILWQDNFDKATITDLLAPYPHAGQFSLTSGHSGNAIRVSYNSSSWNTNLFGRTLSVTSTDTYFRYWYRLSPGADPTCGGRNWSGFKWFMTRRPDPAPRYTHGVSMLTGGPAGYTNTGLEFTTHDNSSTQEPNPFAQNVNKTIKFSTTADGNWHEYTIHIVVGNGGYEQIWVDGTKVLDSQAYAYDHSSIGINDFSLPGTMVQWYSGCEFTVDIDDLAVWHK